ncbi:NAD(P)-dependent oxidoreductase [Oceanobacillus sp. FSL W7-1293]|uniref:NAD(P)-dependent oxidoreductase n=1 Tax=Oceanobacillus TaxID=182709 RepID=UPI0030D3FB04
MKKVGFIGVGAMGHWMVKNLVGHVESLIIFDANKKALKMFEHEHIDLANSIAEVGEKSDLVILMLPNSTIVQDVVLGEGGLINSLRENALIIDMSSSYTFETTKMKALLDKKGIRLLDAPVSGGVPKAKSGELTIMVGGDKDDLQEANEVIRHLGTQIKLIGKTGTGHALKAINNYLAAATMYATAEALMLAKKVGIAPETALESINTSTGRSHSSEFKYPTYVLPREFVSNFSLGLQLKDINMAKDMASDVHMPMLLGSSLIEIYEAASITGGDKQDHTEIIKFLERISEEKLT